MRTRNALERLAGAGRPLLLEADSLVDDAEENRILKRILASDRQTSVRHGPRRRAVLALAGAAVVVAAALAVVATDALGPANQPAVKTGRHHHVALTGPRIELAGYRFRTPAGFEASKSSCPERRRARGRQPCSTASRRPHLPREAASRTFFLRPGSPSAPDATPADAQPVEVGAYKGYIASAGSSDAFTLYVELPAESAPHPYLVLFAQGLTEDQLIAVAVSGLPESP